MIAKNVLQSIRLLADGQFLFIIESELWSDVVNKARDHSRRTVLLGFRQTRDESTPCFMNH